MKPNSWSRASAIAKELRAAGYIVKMERKKPNPLFVSPELDQATFFMSADEAKERLDAMRLEAKFKELVKLQSLSPEECSKIIRSIMNQITKGIGAEDQLELERVTTIIADGCSVDFSDKASDVIAKEMAKSGVVTPKELEALIRFYKSPLGRKQRLLTEAISVPVTKTMIKAAQEWSATVLPAKLREVGNEMFNMIADDMEREGREFLRNLSVGAES